jgi:hypothetical protein
MTDRTPASTLSDLQPTGFGRACFPSSRLGRAYGHDIITDKDGVTRYCDDLSILGDDNLRACAKCGADPRLFDGDDPCLAGLPGVRNACCGHGRDQPYIEFDDGRVVYGDFNIARRVSASNTPANPAPPQDCGPIQRNI